MKAIEGPKAERQRGISGVPPRVRRGAAPDGLRARAQQLIARDPELAHPGPSVDELPHLNDPGRFDPDFGKGSGHPAQLNFGDCFNYALAKEARDALLFKGDDFAHTDVRSALDN